MSLNPVRFGKDLIDQFDRYLLTSFPVADPDLAEQFRRRLAYGPGSQERLAKGPPGGARGQGLPFSSLQLIDVELDGLGRISGHDEYPWRVSFNQFALRLPEHHGGHGGAVGGLLYQFLRNARLRLVNLGPRRKGPVSPQQGSEWPGVGSPICTVCGATRSPFAGPAEIQNFEEHHEKVCGNKPGWHALHTDVVSDLLTFGPFQTLVDCLVATE